MTIHASKGLEFECVFVGGVEETLFPSSMSMNTREELEEERRLFYVAVTRAKQRLWLTHANARYRFGQLVQNEPSRFIAEMPEQYVDKSYAGGGARNNAGADYGSGFDRMQNSFGEAPKRKTSSRPEYMPPPPPTKVATHVPTANFTPSDTSNLQVGAKVEHQKFGFGIVGAMEGSAHNPIATINFEKNGEKKIMLNYAKLRIVE
jgi:DNA helicase-2/ATP-dependent DNA helicase PcrA